MQLIDTHVHINFDLFKGDLDSVSARWQSEGISKLVHSCVHPDEFELYKKMAYNKGFLMVSSSPLTRSSYHAGDDFTKMREERINRLSKK